MSLKSETLIVITRPVEEGAETATYFEQKGFRTHLAPVMEVIYRPFDRETLKQYDGFVVTSQQALKALGDDHGCEEKILFAFGEKTPALAKKKGFDVHALMGHDLSEALPDLLSQLKGQSGRFCYLRGADISVDLKLACAQEQIILDDLILYDAKSLGEPIILPEAQDYAILLFSERSAMSALSLIQRPEASRVQYFCLSEKIKNSIDNVDSSLRRSVFAPSIPMVQNLYHLILTSLA